jgi:adenylyltransferase/sulfurtransferase
MVNASEIRTWGDDVFPLLSWFEAKKVREAKVMVVGAGALGNEVLKNLALFGVGNIAIVDFDTIEYSNLTRSVLFRAEDADRGLYKADVAARRLRGINPNVRTLPVNGDLATGAGLGLYRRMDVVVGCLDSLYARVMLNRLCARAGKTWIDGGIGNLEGQVSVYQPGVSCYECNLTDDEKCRLNRRNPCAGVVMMNEKEGRAATTPVIASLIAAVQVQEAMKYIHPRLIEAGKFSTLAGKMFAYEGMRPSADVFEFASRNQDCTAHEYWRPVVEIPELSAAATVAQALSIIRQTLQTDTVEINLRNDKFVDRIVSRCENKSFSTMLPASKIPDYILADEEMNCLQTVEGFYQHDFENIDDSFPYQELTLQQIGLPPFDVLQVTTPKGLFYVELTHDIKLYEPFVSTR